MPRHITTQDELGSLAGVVGTPEDGQVLTWDSEIGGWTPKPGGVEVGAWELNQTFTWICPSFYEQNMTASPVAVGNVKPAAPTVSFTVTQDMLVTCDRSDVAWEQVMVVDATVDWKTGTGTVGYCYFELLVNGQAITNTSAGGLAVTERTNGAWGYRNPAVGDVVELRLWGNTDFTGVCDWWGRHATPTRMFQPGPSGRYLVTNVREDAYTATPTVATVFSSKGAVTYSAQQSGHYYIGTDYYTGMNVDNKTFLVPSPGYGIHRSYIGDYGMYRVIDSTGVQVAWNQVPTRVTVDRLLIPAPQPVQP